MVLLQIQARHFLHWHQITGSQRWKIKASVKYKPRQNESLPSHIWRRREFKDKDFFPVFLFIFFTLPEPSGKDGTCFWIVMILTTLPSRKRSRSNRDAFPHQKPITVTKGGRGARGGFCTHDWLSPSELWQVRWRDSTPTPPASEPRSLVSKVTVAA